MSDLARKYTDAFYAVSNPAQYVGGEWNSIRKDPDSVRLRFALAFPDTYAIGMSHLGIQILYSILNSREDVAAERVFAPWVDMAKKLRECNIPLLSLESKSPLGDFDIVGFSLQDEVTYTNVLEMLSLAGIPLRSEKRSLEDPLIVAGGPCALSPEPMADFIDLFVLGDGEQEVLKLVDSYMDGRAEGLSRRETLIRLAGASRSFYVPSLYEPSYDSQGRLEGINPAVGEAPRRLTSAVVPLTGSPAPTSPIVPYAQVIHDRITIEIMRGCAWGCRFCHAGMTKRPVRWRSASEIIQIAEESYRSTGHEEISLTSLSSSDYPEMGELLPHLASRFQSRRVNISLPSLRVGAPLEMVADALSEVRKAGLTIALEAATDRLRNVINKDIRLPHLFNGLKQAYRRGWRSVKLYFMVGLPTETDEDIDPIIDLARQVSELRREVGHPSANVNVTISPFVPKAHTPFQWEPMVSEERFREIRERLYRRRGRAGHITLKFHHFQRSYLEALLGRGDRRLGRAIEAAWRKGCVFDGWGEHFDFSKWMEAFQETGIDPDSIACSDRDPNETFPWDHIDTGPRKEFLWAERMKACAAELTECCFHRKCCVCGACDKLPHLGESSLTPRTIRL